MLKKDLRSGTGENPVVVPFVSGKRYALSIVVFCDGEEPIPEGFANSAESQVRGVLQSAGRNVSSVRFIHSLDSGNDSTARVTYELHVAREVDDNSELIEE